MEVTFGVTFNINRKLLLKVTIPNYVNNHLEVLKRCNIKIYFIMHFWDSNEGACILGCSDFFTFKTRLIQ